MRVRNRWKGLLALLLATGLAAPLATGCALFGGGEGSAFERPPVSSGPPAVSSGEYETNTVQRIGWSPRRQPSWRLGGSSRARTASADELAAAAGSRSGLEGIDVAAGGDSPGEAAGALSPAGSDDGGSCGSLTLATLVIVGFGLLAVWMSRRQVGS